MACRPVANTVVNFEIAISYCQTDRLFYARNLSSSALITTAKTKEELLKKIGVKK